MNNFTTRVITAFFFAAFCIMGIYYNGFIHLLFFTFCLLGLKEFYGLIFKEENNTNLFASFFIAITIFLTTGLILFASISLKWLALVIIPTLFLFIQELFLNAEKPFENLAKKIIGIVYVVLPFTLFCALGYLSTNGYQYSLPLGFIFFLWASDSGAYIIGVKFGKHRLFERVSPKKSWEGFVGGLFFSLLTAWIFAGYFPEISKYIWLGMSFLIVVFGTLGDLVESLFKRSINIKDSGSLLPGHGGILDRFDGLLIAAPIVYVYLLLFL